MRSWISAAWNWAIINDNNRKLFVQILLLTPGTWYRQVLRLANLPEVHALSK